MCCERESKSVGHQCVGSSKQLLTYVDEESNLNKIPAKIIFKRIEIYTTFYRGKEYL